MKSKNQKNSRPSRSLPLTLFIPFITHQLPKGLQVDEAVVLGKEQQSAKGQGNQNQQTPSQNSTANSQTVGEERHEP